MSVTINAYSSQTVGRTVSKFCLPFEKATPLVHFPKALKRPRNNAGPAGIGLLIMKGIGLIVMKGTRLLIRKGIRILGVKYCFS